MSAFDKVIGYAAIKDELLRICDYLKNEPEYSALGAKLPRGILLHGDPGLGKTLMAECFVEECGLYSVVIRKDKGEGSFVKYIRQCFKDAAAHAPAVVFLDDMDKFANEDSHHPNTDAYVAVQSCIDNTKNEKVFVIATVNDTENLPYSLLRAGRFDHIIYVDAPTGKDAEEIIRHYLADKPVAEDIDCRELSHILWKKSCADLESVINAAAVFAGYQRKSKIDMDDMVEAILNVVYHMPNSDYGNEIEERDAALHEAGHVVVAEILEPGSVSIATIRIRKTGTSGFVKSHEDAEYEDKNRHEINWVISGLGGRAAIELCCGKIDPGAESDISQGIDKIYDMISCQGFAGFGYVDAERFSNPSSELHFVQERKAQEILSECYKHAVSILQSNQEFLLAVAEELYTKKSLDSRDIARIKEQCNITVCNISMASLLR